MKVSDREIPKTFISQGDSKLDRVNKADGNKFLNEMKYRLDLYNAELEESIKSKTKVEHENFKKTFFYSLESLLQQLAYIKDKELRERKIETIYKWYKVKLTFFQSLNPVDVRTDRNFYEKYPETDRNVKSDYYEAQNFPINFERDHRTEEEGLLPPKDRLKEYKTKKITRPKEVKDRKQSATTHEKEEFFRDEHSSEKQRLQSAASSVAMRSTFYATNQNFNKNFSNSNLNVNNNQELPLDPTRELKSSYSYIRPKYEFNNLMIEKNTIQAKQRELAEKRTQEEMKEFMNEFGLNRARFKEEVEKKYDVKQVINYYEQTLLKDNDQDSDVNVQNSQLDISIEKEKDKSQPVTSYYKIDMNNIKNLGPDNKVKVNPEEIKVNIKVKESNVSGKEINLTSIKSKVEKLPSEMVAKAKMVDPVFSARHTYSKMLNVKEIDNQKSDVTNINKPLSAYDLSNIDLMSPLKAKKIPPRPSTGIELVKRNFDSDDFLKAKKTLSNLKLLDYTRLKDTLIKFNNTTVSFPALQAAFLPSVDEVNYPRFFLPIPGSGILSRPVEIIPKKKTRAISKKR